MQNNKVDMYMLANSKFFHPERLLYIQERLAHLPDEKFGTLYAVELKDPSTMLLVSIFIFHVPGLKPPSLDGQL